MLEFCTLPEEEARRRLDALTLEVAVAQVALLEVGELLARHLCPRLLPGEEPPAPAVVERLVLLILRGCNDLSQV